MRSDPLIESLLEETAESLRNCQVGCDGLRNAILAFLCRAYKLGLSSDAVCDLLGIAGDCVLNRAALDERREDAVMEAYEVYDGILQEKYGLSPSPPAGMRG